MAKTKKRSRATQGQTQQATQATQGGSGPLPDAQRYAFLQAIMQNKWMAEHEAKDIFAKLVNLGRKRASYSDTVAEINSGLSFLLMELRTVHFPIDGDKYIGLVNKEADDVAKTNGSSYSIPQIQYLRALVERIAVDADAEDGVGSISSMEAANTNFSSDFLTQASQSQAGEAKRLNMNEKEAALKMFIKDGWIIARPGRRGHYCIGVRTFLELHDMLLEFDLPKSTKSVWEKLL